MALSGNALVTLETAKLAIGGTVGDAGQVFLEQAINVVSAKIDEFLYGDGYHVISQAYTDVVLDGTGRGLLIMPGPRITAVSAVAARSGKSTWSVVDPANYEFNDYALFGYGYVFAYGTRNYRVTWTAGYALAAVPGAIVEVALHEIVRYMRRQPDVISESVSGPGSMVRTYLNLDDQTKKKLSAFRRGVFA